ncbi:MAG: glutamyl-tRNA reductase [Candidatus Eremiobacteraeota bacterium]|nr:glutamyl-tRNA reductase [Candidatus Eremiobacteraeota bacterium]MBV8366411.1 glutamyl-tRNA reductase [Candidatus Eremiobacteraeota bacterium]
MPIVVIGLSHKTAPDEVRNRHAFPAERIGQALAALRDYAAVREAAIVSTCNRLEIYADVSDFESGVEQIKDFLTTYRRMRVEDFDKYLYTMLGAEAVEQLLRVACGLDSMLVGEEQIVGQVKDALTLAQRTGSAGPHLNKLFRTALETGKRARTKTRIGSDVVSLGAAAVELAARHCALRAARAVVVGAGKMGTIVAKHLHARGVAALAVVNRTLARGQRLAAAIGVQAAPIEDLPSTLRACDLLITATGGGGHVVTAPMVAHALAHNGGRMLIVDIAVPNDVEANAGALPGVTLYQIGDLREIVDATLDDRKAEIPAVEAIVAERVAAYVRWYQSRAAAPLIATLRTKAEDIRRTELTRLFARLPELDDRQRELIAGMSVSILNRLLHAPVTKLRETAADGMDMSAADLATRLSDLAGLGEQLEAQLARALRPPELPAGDR